MVEDGETVEEDTLLENMSIEGDTVVLSAGFKNNEDDDNEADDDAVVTACLWWVSGLDDIGYDVCREWDGFDDS